MTDRAPVLYVFPISHYCEKARWALDWFGIPYSPAVLGPGLHQVKLKRLGAEATSVPVLHLADGTLVQGSSAIIDWAEVNRVRPATPLSPCCEVDAAIEAEHRLDTVLGVQARRLYYSEALVEHSARVRDTFANPLSPLARWTVRLGWPVLRSAMLKGMDCGPAQFAAARQKVVAELDWLDALLADGRPYLFADRFSRADLTAASLLAPFARPPAHPIYRDVFLPPRIAADAAEWQARPCFRWVQGLYRQHRFG